MFDDELFRLRPFKKPDATQVASPGARARTSVPTAENVGGHPAGRECWAPLLVL